MKTRHNLFAAFEKVEIQDDGTLIVKGIASSEAKDSDGEIVKADAMRAALPDYMTFGAVREMHQPIAAGTAISASVDDSGITRFEAHIVDESSVKKVNAGVLKGFSVGGRVTKRNASDKKIIEGIRLTEISLVDRPANPDAVISLVKFDAGGAVVDPPTPKAEKAKTVIVDGPLIKGLYDVSRLADLIQSLHWLSECAASEAATEGDGSSVPARLNAAVKDLCLIIRDMVDEETAELLGMADEEDILASAAAAVVKAFGAGSLLKSGKTFSAATVEKIAGMHDHANALSKMAGELVGKFDSLGYKAADNPEDSDTMTDSEKAAHAAELVKAAGDATAAANAASAATVTDLTDKLGKATKAAEDATAAAAAATKTAQDLADAIVAKGAVRAIPKTADGTGAAAGDDDIAKAQRGEKPADFRSAFRATVARPLSPVRGI